MTTPRHDLKSSTTANPNPASQDELRLLVEWQNPLSVFSGNLADRLFGQVVPGMVTTSAPDHGFWRDVQIPAPFPGRGLLDSVFAHAALLGLLYAISIWPNPTPHLTDPLSHHSLIGYTLSEYLPELHGSPPTHPRNAGRRDPVTAKQEITSLPETPDNLRQTIIAPPKIKLERDLVLPNIAAYQPAAPVQPLAASQRESAARRLPAFIPEVVGPTAETDSLRSPSRLPSFQPMVVEPAPDLANANPRLTLPAFQPKVVEPAPDLDFATPNGSANLSHLAPRVAAPIPESPQVADAQHASAQIIALNLHPAEVHGPVDLPSGNRRGTFATSPTGRPDALGTPGTDASGTGMPESKTPVNAPAGIHVAAAAPNATVAAPNSPAPQIALPDPGVRSKLMAAMHPPIASIPRQPVALETTEPRSDLEKRVFAGRRSYALLVNMPNLNTATGSWIIHFVEREPGPVPSPIAAPEVVKKSDPAYPGELMHDGIQGTVILTAIIRADGSVGDIVVAKGLDPRLDRNAAQALSRWLFRPALKNGHAIDLQAVITVPFRVRAARF